jgi:hypothetical protein
MDGLGRRGACESDAGSLGALALVSSDTYTSYVLEGMRRI